MLDTLIFQKKHRERTMEMIKKVIENLNYDEIEFPFQEKDLSKMEVKNSICIKVFR